MNKPLPPLLQRIEPDHHEYPPMLGPLEAVPVGSPEWAERLGLRIKHGVERIKHQGIEHLIPSIEMALDANPSPWQIWPPERPCLTPDEYFFYAAHIRCTSLAKLVAAYKGDKYPLVERLQKATNLGEKQRFAQEADRRDDENHSRQGQRTDLVHNTCNDVNDVGRPWGNSVEAALRRLRKDRPDLHMRVLNGEMTANKAMIEAGFRKPRKPNPLHGLRALHRAWGRATSEARAAFKAEICP